MKLRPCGQKSVTRRVYQILSSRYYGPFPITHKIEKVAYQVQLPAESRHPTFHVSQLKKSIGDKVVEPTLPASMAIDDQEVLETVLARRKETKQGEDSSQILTH